MKRIFLFSILCACLCAGSALAGGLVTLNVSTYTFAYTGGDQVLCGCVGTTGNFYAATYHRVMEFDDNGVLLTTATLVDNTNFNASKDYNMSPAGDGGVYVVVHSSAYRYDTGLNLTASACFGATGSYSDVIPNLNAITADSSGNVYTAGNRILVKSDQYLNVLSSAAFNSWPTYSALDSNGNIIICSGSYNIFKYDKNLNLLASDASLYQASIYVFDDENYSNSYEGAAGDAAGNVFACGRIIPGRVEGSPSYGFIAKYDRNLHVISSATYNDSNSWFHCVSVDAAGRVWASGVDGSRFITVVYDNNLQVVLASDTYPGGSSYYGIEGAGFDGQGNFLAAGMSNTAVTYNTFKYRGGPVASTISGVSTAELAGSTFTATITGNSFYAGLSASSEPGVTVTSVTVQDANHCTVSLSVSSPVVSGQRDLTITDLSGLSCVCAGTITVRGIPYVSAVSTPSAINPGASFNASITGSGFYTGTSVSFGQGITVTNVTEQDPYHCAASVTVSTSAPLGPRDMTIADAVTGFSGTFAGAFSVTAVQASTGAGCAYGAYTSTGCTLNINTQSGQITISIPGGTFSQNVNVALSTCSVPSISQAGVVPTSIGIEITNSAGLQPQKTYTLTVYYRPQDIVGLDASKLVIARYDPDNNRWLPLPTTVYASQGMLVAELNHMSTFAVVQLAPCASLSGAKAYPNPYFPANGSLTIANLTDSASIRIFNVAGELVRALPYTSGNGRAAWDGRNDAGSYVASGVYLARITSAAGNRTLKIAVER